MVTTEFSEFSYGFAVVSELMADPGTGVRAPQFPSLNEEGQLGFDVAIPDTAYGIPLFLQFKRPEWLVSERAGQWQHFNAEYFRFPLRTGRTGGVDQHALLIELEQRFPGQVLYVAARFATADALTTAFDTQTVVDRSIILRPIDIGEVGPAQLHRVAYSVDSTLDFLRCSTPERRDKPPDGQLLESALSGERWPVSTIQDRLERFLATRLTERRPSVPRRRGPAQLGSALDELATELRYLLNIEFLMAAVAEEGDG